MGDQRRESESQCPLHGIGTAELLAELARRMRIRFGRIEVRIHNGRPSEKIVVEHRSHVDLD